MDFEELVKHFGYNDPIDIIENKEYYFHFPAKNKKWGQLLVEKAEEIVRYEKTIEKLNNGEDVINAEGGNSMLPIIKSRQPVVLSPILDKSKLKIDDIVLAKVRGNFYLHKISAIEGKRVQISNNHGHINGWTTKDKVYGIVTKILPM